MCRGCHAERFFERVLFAPINLKFIAWQKKFIRDVFGAVDQATGERIYTAAYAEIPKKNGKSFLVGGVPVYHLVGEGVERPHAYGAAAAREQAGLVYRAAVQMVRAQPMLADILKINESTKRIVKRDGSGFYAVLSADGGLQDGIEPSLAVMDELHRWKGSRAEALYEVLTAGSISRDSRLKIEITTAGDVYESPLCWREHQRAKLISTGAAPVGRFYSMLYGVDEQKLKDDSDYWKSREARVEANPSHEDNGGFLRDSAILEMQAELSPAAYKRYHLNVWGQKAEQWMPTEKWLACATPTRPLIGRPCWVGLDLSKTSDLTALVAVFPDDDGSVDVLPFFFFPTESVHEAAKKVPVPLRDWMKRGLMIPCEGAVVDYNAVRAKLDWMASVFQVQEICFDPYNASHFVSQLVDAGYTCIEVRQGARSLSAPMKWIEELVLTQQLRHGGHEVLTWNFDCTSIRPDENANIAPQKRNLDREGKRIDGISAMITACSRAMIPAVRDPYSSGVRLTSL